MINYATLFAAPSEVTGRFIFRQPTDDCFQLIYTSTDEQCHRRMVTNYVRSNKTNLSLELTVIMVEFHVHR